MSSKHEVMHRWVEQFLTDNYLYFESADAYAGVREMVPNYGDYLDHTDVVGFKYKSYTFVFIGYEQLDSGASDGYNNITKRQLFEEFLDWIEQQKELRNYPDFGEKCSDYEIVPLQNMANLAEVDERGLAKYMFAVRIDYKEE